MERLESVEVTPAMRDLIRRRTDWIARDFFYFERSLRMAALSAALITP